jgi:hypothetical protein
MNGQNELLTIAEIAISIAGFAGMIVAFANRGRLTLADQLRFLGVFVIAFSALLLAFFPIALFYGDFRSQQVWRISSIVMVFWSILGFIPYPFALRKIVAELEGHTLLPVALFLFPFIGNIILQILNSSAWLWKPNFIPYLAGVLTYLYIASLFFVLIVIFRPSK